VESSFILAPREEAGAESTLAVGLHCDQCTDQVLIVENPTFMAQSC